MLDLSRYSGAGADAILAASALAEAAAGSLEDIRDRVRAAWRARFPADSYDHPVILWTFADHVVVDDSAGAYWRYPYTDSDNTIAFGEPGQVEMIFRPVAGAAQEAEAHATWGLDLAEAQWTATDINKLPDTAFLYVAPGGNKDGDGLTTPRTLRYFPVRDARGTLDLPHIRNALSRASGAKLPKAIIERVTKRGEKLLAQASKAKPAKESGRAWCLEFQPLTEGPTDGRLPITVITPGFNRSQARFYRPEALRQAVDEGQLEGLKMYADHQTRDQAKARPEGSIRDWVANLEAPRINEETGAIEATAVVIDPTMDAKLGLMAERGQLGSIGTSIRAIGNCQREQIGGVTTEAIHSFAGFRSVDWVTEPGAGGGVITEADEEDELDLDVVSIETVRERRPDLITALRRQTLQEVADATQTLGGDPDAIEEALAGRTRQEDTTMTEQEQAAAAAQARALAEANLHRLQGAYDLREAQTRTTALEAAERQRRHGTIIDLVLIEAKAPPPIVTRVRARFATAETVEASAVKTAISEELDFVRQVTGAGTVRHLGESHDTPAPDAEAATTGLQEAFQALGLDEEGAKVAAASR